MINTTLRPQFQRFLHYMGNLLETEAAASGPPPQTLRSFAKWCLAGAWPVIVVATAFSVLAGASEVFSMYLLGRVVDAAANPTANFWADNWAVLVGAVFLMIVFRPILMGMLAVTQSVMIGPGVFKLVLARLHRWTLGQSVTFFDNDFAGRIAQKQMQAANSLTEVVIESVNALAFGLAAILGTAVLLLTVDARLLLILVLWFGTYLVFLRFMLPRIRAKAKARAAARANVSGQIVDTITNIKTVKLFAGSAHEDRAAIHSMEDLRTKALLFGEVSSAFRFGLIFLAGVLPVTMVGAALALRNNGVTPGDIAAVGAVAIRLSQMTGWISFTLMGIYATLANLRTRCTR